MRHRRRLAAGLAFALCVLAGCSGGDSPPRSDAGTTPPVDRHEVEGPEVEGPRMDPAPAPRPPIAVQAAVDLSPAVPGGIATATAAVGTPDGGAYVVLSTPELGLPNYLASVARTAGGYTLTASVPIPRLRPVWDVHVLASGRVLVSGQFRGNRTGYGFLSVDPVRGKVRTAEVVPFEDGTELASGSSVLSLDGETITLFLSSFVDGRQLDLLVAADASNGAIRGGRDLFGEVRAVSESGVGPWSTWLFARPDGGVDLLFDAYPPGVGIARVPTLIRYDRELEPVLGPVPVTGVVDDARLRAAAVAADGTVFVRVDAPDGAALVEVAPAGTPSAVPLDLPQPADDDALVVDPAQGWALVPAVEGARAVDLATGGSTPVPVGCAPGVDQLVPGRGGVGALMLGRCGPRGAAVPTLWIAGPAR